MMSRVDAVKALITKLPNAFNSSKTKALSYCELIADKLHEYKVLLTYNQKT